jgi:hypothetical protein
MPYALQYTHGGGCRAQTLSERREKKKKEGTFLLLLLSWVVWVGVL